MARKTKPKSEAAARRERRDRNRRKPDLLGALRTALVLALILQGVRVAFTSPLMRLQEVEVAGSERFTPEELVRKAHIPLGKNIFAVNLVQVSDRLREEPVLEDAVVTRQFPQGLRIKLTEREPELRVSSRGRIFLADGAGVVYEPQDKPRPELPLLEIAEKELPPLGQALKPEWVRAVRECVRLAEKEGLTLGKMRVDASGELWLNVEAPQARGTAPAILKVRVGRATELPEKFRDIRLALASRPDLPGSASYLDVMCAGRTAYAPLPKEDRTQ